MNFNLDELELSLKNKIKSILLLKNFPSFEITNDSSLIKLGLDSLDIVSLVAFLDTKLDGKLIDADFNANDFTSLSTIRILIEKVAF